MISVNSVNFSFERREQSLLDRDDRGFLQRSVVRVTICYSEFLKLPFDLPLTVMPADRATVSHSEVTHLPIPEGVTVTADHGIYIMVHFVIAVSY